MSYQARYAALGVMLGFSAQGSTVKAVFDREPEMLVRVPWCVAVVQKAATLATHACDLRNPLEGLGQEISLQAYTDWATQNNRTVSMLDASIGDLVMFSINRKTYDQIGFLQTEPNKYGKFLTVEGEALKHAVVSKDLARSIHTGRLPVLFIRWTP